MFGIIEVPIFLQLVDVGVAIAMLFVFIRLYTKKDKEHENLHKLTTKRLTEIIAEVTAALQDKNNTDDKMSATLDELTEVIRRLEVIEEEE